MKHIVDIETWERRDNYAFFRNFLNSWISVATEVDCTEARAAAKATGRSFFLYYLYAVLRSVNEIEEFRYRTDSSGNVVYHDRVDVITPIAVPGRTFYTVRIPYHAEFDRFYARARAIVTGIPSDGDPYGEEKVLQAQGDYDVFLLSATPKLYFTSVTYAQGAPGQPTEYPLMNAGKAVAREGRLVMPLSIFVNHAFVDGEHISRFFELVAALLKRISCPRNGRSRRPGIQVASFLLYLPYETSDNHPGTPRRRAVCDGAGGYAPDTRRQGARHGRRSHDDPVGFTRHL